MELDLVKYSFISAYLTQRTARNSSAMLLFRFMDLQMHRCLKIHFILYEHANTEEKTTSVLLIFTTSSRLFQCNHYLDYLMILKIYGLWLRNLDWMI
jgi:hypothetical protein